MGEYWSEDLAELRGYLGDEPVMSLFDVPLHFHLHAAATSDGNVDLSRLFEGTLVDADPAHAVTFVENHDTQPRQALASTILPWFKPSAYALILLREAGIPCVFWGDLFGTPETGDLPAVTELPLLMAARRLLAHGPQHDTAAPLSKLKIFGRPYLETADFMTVIRLTKVSLKKTLAPSKIGRAHV